MKSKRKEGMCLNVSQLQILSMLTKDVVLLISEIIYNMSQNAHEKPEYKLREQLF